MKTKIVLLSAFAGLSAMASCQKDGAQTTTPDARKSVTMTISNIAAPATRSSQSDFTPTEVPVASLTDLQVLFASADGTVVESRTLTDETGTDVDTDIIDPNGTGISYEYTFHQVPESATRLAITNSEVTVDDIDDIGDALDAFALSGYQGAYASNVLPTIPVLGTSGTWTDTGDTDPADGFKIWDAGEVDVAPALARIEIGNIECLNLGGTSVGTNGLYPRFGSLTLANIGIHSTSLTTVAGAAFAYTNDDAATTGLPKWNADVAAADPAGWNIDPIGATLTGTGNMYSDGVFGFNVAPGAAPNVILEITGATENTAVEIPGEVDPTAHYFVKTTGLSDGTGPIVFKAGYIYRLDFGFNSENVLPWDGQEEFVCVDVTVIVPDWVIYPDTLAPVFE